MLRELIVAETRKHQRNTREACYTLYFDFFIAASLFSLFSYGFIVSRHLAPYDFARAFRRYSFEYGCTLAIRVANKKHTIGCL